MAILASPTGRVAGQSDLVAAWAFSEALGTTAADESGNGNTAALNGTGWTSSGKFDAAVTFDGADDRLDVPDATSLDLSGALTLEAWVFASASNQARTLVAKESAGAIAYGLFLTSDARLELQVDAGGTLRTIASVTSVATETWTHVAGTYDGSTLRVWINGLEENSLAATGSIATSDQPLRLGGDTVLNQPFAGRLDEVRLYSRALTASELVADMDVAVNDVTAPSVSTKTPAASATGVAVSANVTATFSESLAVSTVSTSTFELRDAQSTLVAAAVSYSDATKTVTLDPSATLAGSTTYTATVKGASTPRITDLAGNPIVADYSWSFTTIDTGPPSVTSVTPVAGTRNVSLATTLTATFSEPLDPATVTTSTFELRDTRNALVTGAVAYDAPSQTATFTPGAPLLPTRTYTATLIGGTSGLKDLAGNALAANYTWAFISTVERTRIAAGSTHSAAVDDAGQVWTWGSDSFGERGTDLDGRLPGAVTLATGVVSVAAAVSHTLALKSDGTVLSWGWNNEGQLGNGNQNNQATPVAVSSLTNVIAVAAGGTHSVALRGDGTVWTWGSAGQIGDGANTRRLTPVQVPALSDVIAVAAGHDHTLALKADGTVRAWGANGSGQLGNGTLTASLTPIQVSDLSGVVGIAGGSVHSLSIVGTDLSVRAWGANTFGQLGDGSTTPRTTPVTAGTLSNVRLVAAGKVRSAAALLDTTTRSWGRLAQADGASSTSPVAVPGTPPASTIVVGDQHTLAVTTDGIVSAAVFLSSVGQLGDGTYAVRPAAVSISDTGYAWKVSTPAPSPGPGTYTSVQNVFVTALTSGATIRYTTDDAAPTESSAAVPANGLVPVDRTLTLKLKAWKTGKPASNIETATYTLKVPPPALSPGAGTYNTTRIVTVSVSVPAATLRYTTTGVDPTATDPEVLNGGTIAVDQTTTLKVRAWKDNWSPSDVTTATYTMRVGTPTLGPGSGSCPAPCLVTVSTVTSGATLRYTISGAEPATADPVVASGATVVIASSGSLRVKGWRTGWADSVTSLASYNVTQGTVAAPVATPAGGTYGAAQIVTLASGTAGAVIRYTLDGAEPTLRSLLYSAPLRLADPVTLKAKGFRADWIPSAMVTETYVFDYGTVATPTVTPGPGDYAVTLSATVATTTAGATIRYTTDGSDPNESSPSVTSGGSVVIDRPLRLKLQASKAGMLPSPVRVADYGLTGALAAGDSHTLALKSDGTVWSWGLNNEGQLGDGTPTQRKVPTAVTGLTGIVAVAGGKYHSLALKADGTVWSWGQNQYRQLGDGTNSQRRTPVQVIGVSDVVAIAAGDQHSLALKRDGTVMAWGDPAAGAFANPTAVQVLTGVIAIAAGSLHNVALKTDGEPTGGVWTWGANANGELGDGTTSTRTVPAMVLAGASAVFAGRNLTFVRSADGTTWGWGKQFVIPEEDV